MWFQALNSQINVFNLEYLLKPESMKWILRGEPALGEVGWQKKCTVDGGKGILQVERFNQGWKKCGVGERVNQKYARRKTSFRTNITF